MKNNLRSTTPMNLQLFAGLDDEAFQNQVMQMLEGAGQEGQPAPEPQPAAAPTPDGAAAPPAGEPAPQPAQPQEPMPAPGQEQPPAGGQPAPAGPQDQLIGGKFKSVDDLLNAYQNVESAFSRKSQEAAQYKAMAEQLQKQQTSIQDPAPQAQAQQTSPEGEVNLLEDDEALAEMLYSNPAKVFQMLREEAKREAETAVKPILDKEAQLQAQQAWQERVDAFAALHPDLDNWREPMGQILMENPELGNHPNGLEIAYMAAKGKNYTPPPDPASLLNDQEFVKNNILNNENIQNQIVQQYLAKIQNGGQPLSIGQADAGGSTPITPPKRPTSLEEAGEMALGWFNKQK